jgi:hypothetical protein
MAVRETDPVGRGAVLAQYLSDLAQLVVLPYDSPVLHQLVALGRAHVLTSSEPVGIR